MISGFGGIVGRKARLLQDIVSWLSREIDERGGGPVFLPTVCGGQLIRSFSQDSNLRNFTVRFEEKEYGVLRPEGTLLNLIWRDSNKRYYLDYYYGPMFRVERPGALHQREFWQFCLEEAGRDSLPWADRVCILVRLSRWLGLEPLLRVNFLGPTGCLERTMQTLARERQVPVRKLRNMIDKATINLSVWRSLREDPAYRGYLPKLIGYLRQLMTQRVPYVWDTSLVRGLEYYSDLVFELEVRGTVIAGGGFYSGLYSRVDTSKANYHAFGWGLGLNRLLGQLVDPAK